MKVRILAFLICSFSACSLFAQHHVKGSIVDSAATYKMTNTTITILKQQDSILVGFTRADSEGNFQLSQLPSGKFILMATYPGYADYIEDFNLDSLHTIKDFGPIQLMLKATLLEGVVIQGKAAAIKIKGDTTEYNASSFSIQQNSKVEDLLKQLPGIQVDKDGKITAQGKTVNKVLVDGEEFFGDDPTLVTKNFRGDMVDKVQLYDKSSEKAEFTGIDDGEKTKTINIQLKEDKKNGYFGKINVGQGTDKFYEHQAMLNVFKGKKKIAGYVNMANTGKTGLGWGDSQKYGGGGIEGGEDGQSMVIVSGGDEDFGGFDGRYGGQGIPKSISGGVHYEDKWNKDKESINSNYKIGNMDVEGVQSSLTQNNLPNGMIISSSDQDFRKHLFQQRLDTRYTLSIDSSTTLKISVDGTVKKTSTEDIFQTNSSRADKSPLNSSSRTLSNEGKGQVFGGNALFSKKLPKKGRTYTIWVFGKVKNDDGEGFLNAKNDFYNAGGTLDSSQLTDQYKTRYLRDNRLSTDLSYTEPLSKSLSMSILYGFDLMHSKSDRKSFNQSATGRYDILDETFSNNFDLQQFINRGGLSINYKKNKTLINIGNDLAQVSFRQKDLYRNTDFKRNFINWNPRASYQYNISKQRGFRFNYDGRTSQPGIDQIQPVRNNNDPLNVTLGNTALRPSFGSNLNLSYSSFKILSEQYIWLSASYNFTSNAFSNNVITDETGKTTSQTINLKGHTPSGYNFYVSVDQNIKAINTRIGLEAGVNNNTSFNMVNSQLNTSKSAGYSGTLSISKSKIDRYYFYLRGGPTYNTNSASLQPNTNNNGWGANGSGSMTLYLPGKLEIGTSGNYEFRGKTKTFDETFDRFLWNASLSKKFLKTENLKLSLIGQDLLNQNKGFDRSASNNMISQNSYTTIRRYFLLSLSWDFSKMGIDNSKP